jgi:hypothetical protein
MLRLISKAVLLAALLAALVISSVPAFASNVCFCLSAKCMAGKSCPQGGCQFDKKTSQCVNVSCNGLCY